MNEAQEAMTDKDIEKRRDDALRRALSTPPKPKQESGKGKGIKKPEKPTTSR